MKSFEGQFASRKKVDLRGRSRVEESREQILQRTREERERRRQQKLEQKSATTIQASWRGYRAKERARNDMRNTWERLYGVEGECTDSGQLASPLFRELSFFAKPSNGADVSKVAHAGQALLQPATVPTGLSKEDAAAAILRGRKLAALGLTAIMAQAEAALDREGRLRTPTLQHATQEALVSCIQAFIGEAFWKQQGIEQASQAASSVLNRLADQFPALASALLASEQSHTNNVRVVDSPVSKLLVSLTSQTMHLRPPDALAQLPHLFAIPLLWERYPKLRHLQPVLWQTVLQSLAAPGKETDLSTWLHPQHSSQSPEGGAAILLGNLVQAAGAGLQAQTQPSARTTAALTFLQAAQSLLEQVQQSMSLGETSMDIDEDDEPPSGSLSAQPDALLGPGNSALEQKVALQIQGISSMEVLKPLVQALLPYESAKGPSNSGDHAKRLGTVYRLCELLDSTLDMAPLRQNTLIVLAVSAELIPRLWYGALEGAWASGHWQPMHDDRHGPGWMMPLVILSKVYTTYLSTFGDDYMYEQQKPLPLSELYSSERNEGLIGLLKYGLWQVLWVETQPASRGWTGRAAALRGKLKSSVAAVLGQLNSRNCRRPFAPASAFQTQDLPPARFHAEVKSAAASLGGLMEATHTRVWAILTHAPFLIAFEERAQVFQTVIAADRDRRREMGAYGPQTFVTIHRDTLMQDAFERLGQMDEELRSRIRIQYVDTYGEVEAGVDGGGLFKDFMENLVREGFNPDVGLFRTTAEHKLYPNPAAAAVVPNAQQLFEFMGKMLGKAMYEGILLEVPLASFFLKKLLHMGCDLHDLPSLDAELYKSLLFLRDYAGDTEDLTLSFTVTDGALGQNREIELVPGGRERPVTNSSRLEYIHRVAHFKLNVQPKRASEAFRNGLEMVIPHEWLRMFNEGELQALVGGGDHQGLDIADMKSHVNYAGGYHEDHPVIKEFWNALEGFTPDQQKVFLRFVTACSRPPLLGFKYLDPALCVQMAGGVLDEAAQERLPSSSTCINLLKLPPYRTAEAIRSKLLFAIKNVAGFDLS